MSRCIELTVECETDITIEKITLKSKDGIHRDFKVLQKGWIAFPARAKLQRSFWIEVNRQGLGELSASLGQNSHFFNGLIHPQAMHSTEDVNLNAIIGDRRVAKIYEILTRMDPGVASKVAAKMYEDQLAIFQTTATESIIPNFEKHAIESKLFLASQFCDPADCRKMMNEWSQWHLDNLEGRSHQFKYQAGPDFLFFANMKVNQTIKTRGFSIEQANTWVAEVIAPVRKSNSWPIPLYLSEEWMLTSDSTPNRQDGLLKIPFMSSSGTFVNRKAQLKVLELIDDAMRADSP